jgi:hypothetical protein
LKETVLKEWQVKVVTLRVRRRGGEEERRRENMEYQILATMCVSRF